MGARALSQVTAPAWVPPLPTSQVPSHPAWPHLDFSPCCEALPSRMTSSGGRRVLPTPTSGSIATWAGGSLRDPRPSHLVPTQEARQTVAPHREGPGLPRLVLLNLVRFSRDHVHAFSPAPEG